MRRPRLRPTLAALTLVFLASGLTAFVPRASAIDPFPINPVVTLSSDHFMVHYSGNDQDSTCTNFITQQSAGDLLGMFERAYTQFHSVMGYPTPVDDGDGKVDVSVDDFTNVCIPYGTIPPATPVPYDRWDGIIAPTATPGADDIHLNATTGLTYPIVAHELFHLMEDAIAPGTDQWLQEGTAEWAAVRANLAAGGDEANPDRTVDCVGAECGDTDFDKNGYPGWMLFEYLAERYGDAEVRAVWDQAALSAPGTPGTTILGAVLPVSLGNFFNDYTTARLTGNFTSPVLAGVLPTPYGTMDVSETTGALPTGVVAVNHLAVRYVTLSHGTSNGPCYEASLTINVTIPAGVQSTPTYYSNTKGASAQALTASGSSASITVPWNTCSGSPDAYLSLPNDTLGLDGREFKLTGSVIVFKTNPATASEPPPGVHVIGSVISAPTSDPAPMLQVYAPELLRVSAKTRLLRLAVFSSGDGKLQALLGSMSLGTASLRSGNNDVRFVLPKQLFNSLRTKSASNLLQLTSVSPGGSKGATVTRRVLVQTPKKPKPKHRK
ncbi:MAG: hypothetical protein E6G03_00485 [Actinobacteria bacterium]|nr:MAG: hypothetical protein E6G03_00485 [Actinomycetota bacterium]